jgi:hypothetical protein
MLPELHFQLTPEAYAAFEARLAPLGITIRDTGRQTIEDLENDRIEMAMVSGDMVFPGSTFHFRRHTDRCGGHQLSVLLDDHDVASLSTLTDVLEQAFPQPKVRHARTPRPWTIRRMSQCFGCAVALACFGVICFLGTLGLMALVGWF